MSCSSRSTARKCYLGKSSGTPQEAQIEEWRLMPDHVHMLISVPPKYLVVEARGTSRPVGRNEEMIRAKVKIRK